MSTTVNALLREDLRDFGGYKSARSEALSGSIWLNANESAWANASDPGAALRRYPQPQPDALRERLARLYDVAPAQLLIGRGSDEGIDLLVRAFCAPGRGRIVIAPPVFGMYAVCARLQGAEVIEVPLVDGSGGLQADLPAMGDAALESGASLLFLCTPGNPSGELLAFDAIAALAARLRGRCLVVVDEAYLEYADAPSASTLLADHDNIAVLRTLSKAHALAAEVRIYDRLFLDPHPDAGEKNFLDALNPNAKRVTQAYIEPGLVSAAPEDRVQFERHGYFVADRHDAVPGKPVFNRIVSLKDSWAVKPAKGGGK